MRASGQPPVRLLTVADIPAPVELRVSPRAARLSMRLDVATGTVRVTVPARVPPADIERFLSRHAGWARRRLADLPPRLPFADGVAVPVLGRARTIRHDPSHRGALTVCDDALIVGGDPAFLARRVRDGLKAHARDVLAEMSRAKAATVARKVVAVSVRDTVSRWGSCSSTGRLSYSWRLIFTPEHVVDYVAAHEVAHLVELNHSHRFWRLVATLTPHGDAARAWLKAHGPGLLRIG